MKLHELLARERDIRKRVLAEMTELLRMVGTNQLLIGIFKRYEPVDESGVRYPDERSPVHLRYQDAYDRFMEAWAMEVEAIVQRDRSNMGARADVVVDGQIIVADLPATSLLYLEKQIEHVKTLVEKTLELPIGADWQYDRETGLHKTDERLTLKTEKLQEALLLVAPTERHPGQAQVITKDKTVGHWYTTHFAGMIPAARKREFLAKIAKLSDAIKEARERANSVQAAEPDDSGEKMMAYIFGEVR